MKMFRQIFIGLVLVCSFFVGQARASLFYDDFNSGLDLDVWEKEYIGSSTWTWQPDGYITAGTHWNLPDRMLDIVTKKDDFSDFVFTWEMRANSEVYHDDRRWAHFRSNNDFPYVDGYFVHTTVQYAYTGKDSLWFGKMNPDNTITWLDGVDLGFNFFQLRQWYNYKLLADGNEFKVKTWKQGTVEPDTWLLSASDPDNTYTQGRIGFGNYWQADTFIDNPTVGLVPEPVSMLLFGSGFSVLFGFRRRKNV